MLHFRSLFPCSALLLCMAALLGGQANAAGELEKIQSSGKFRIGFSTSTPGLIEQQNGKVTGFAAELVSLLAKETKIKGVT